MKLKIRAALPSGATHYSTQKKKKKKTSMLRRRIWFGSHYNSIKHIYLGFEVIYTIGGKNEVRDGGY
jgi:hypothetical protein